MLKKNTSFTQHGIFTVLGLAWDACLKKTGVQLEFLSDPDMLLVIEKGNRAGVSMIPTRYSKANNKYMVLKYNPDEESKFLQCLDANKLYDCMAGQLVNLCPFVISCG